MPLDFRLASKRDEPLKFETRIAISYAYTIEQNILELVEAGASATTPTLPVCQLGENPGQIGERERKRIGVASATQMAWKWGDAFRNWRTLIEAAGVYVLLKKWPLNDCLGFTVYRDRNAPIIVINKMHTFEPARTFTLLHEYAHILLRQPGISDLNDENPVETFCNRFAAAFLMPRDLLMEVLPYWPEKPVEWAFSDIKAWARRLKVSQQALAIRLESLGVAPVGFYTRLVEQQSDTPRREDDGGNYVNTQVNELGDRYTGTVLGAERRATITEGEASEMLDLAPRHFRNVRGMLERQCQRVGVADW